MGFFDDLFGQPFGGLFDMDGDGKTDLGEELLGFMVMEQCMNQDEEKHSSDNVFDFDDLDDLDDD